MPGMGSFGSETIAGFYPYLFLEFVAILGLVWLVVGVRLGTGRLNWLGGAALGEGVGGIQPGSAGLRARRLLRWAIGGLWVLDGLLQAQPAMPGGFAENVLRPASLGTPGWLANLIHWEMYFWQAHPLDLAVATVLAQVGIGVAILAGGDARVGRIGLYCSIAWGLFVWVGGEALGGLLAPGATQMMGAPGAVLVYVAAALLLLAPPRLWTEGQAVTWLRLGTGGVLVFGALLQALPFEGFWSGRGLSAMFLSMAQVPQPRFLSAPVLGMAHLAQSSPVAVNLAFVLIMAALGLGLISGRAPRRWIVAALVWLAFTWWVGQDFGALGSRTATDPNLAPLLAVLLLGHWVGRSPRTVPVPVTRLQAPTVRWLGLRATCAWAGLLALGVGLVPVLLGVPVAAAQSSTIEALNTGGPLSAVNDLSVPDLTLVNQAGHQVDLRQWGDRAEVITFLDPVCFDVCPVIAEQLAAADRELGPLAKHVEFVAVVSNPVYHSLRVVRSFDSDLLLNRLPNWQFLTGSLPQLERVWGAFSIEISLPRLQMVAHPTVLYFVRPGNLEVSLTQDSALSNAGVITSYAALIDQELRSIAPS
ncbi:MAG: SCO family protein [Candidatus Dormibacteria bacterium]